MAIGAANGSRIQDAFYFLGIARFRLHHHPQALQLEFTHRVPAPADRHLNKR